MRLVLLGPPGAGKGTQAALLSDRCKIAHLSTGDMLRAARAAKTPVGLRAAEIMDRGDLVPDDVMIAIISDRIDEPDCANGFILDGFPRTIPQAEALERLLADRNIGLDAVVRIAVDEAILLDRIVKRAESGEGRADDKAETLKNRLDVFRKQTAPLIEFYSSRGVMREVDGMQSIEEVAASMDKALRVATT